MTSKSWIRIGAFALACGLGALQGCTGGGSAAGAPAGVSPPGGPPGPTPGGGWIVATRFAADQESIDVFPAGTAGATPVQSVAGATVLGAIEGFGIAYGKDSGPLGYAELGIFRPGDAQRIVLGAEAGHGYSFVTDTTSETPFLAGGRLMVADTSGTSEASLRSFAGDGTDPRTLTTGACAGIFGARMRTEGIAFACDPETLYFSDGASPAVPLGSNAALSLPVELTAIGPRRYVVLMTATSRLITMPADGSNAFERLSPDPSGTDTLLAMAGSTALVTTAITATDHATYTVSADASSRTVRRSGVAGATVPGSPRVTPDRSHFLVIYRDDVGTQARAFLVPVDPDDQDSIALPTPSGTASALDATQFADGTLLVKLAGVGYQTVSPAGEAGVVIDGSVGDVHRADAGSWAVFQSPVPPHPMKAVRQDGTEMFPLTEAGADGRSPLVSPSGRIYFLDANGLAWVAAPERSERTLVDATPCDAIMLTGGDGARELLAARHITGDYATFVIHTDTGQVEEVLGGATSGVGWFLP